MAKRVIEYFANLKTSPENKDITKTEDNKMDEVLIFISINILNILRQF